MPGCETARVIEGYHSVLEDRAEVIEVGQALVVIVADGAGGRLGGAQAAQFVVQHVRAVANSSRTGCSSIPAMSGSVLNFS
jgi:serine/threonine protein phosphatase PrpC